MAKKKESGKLTAADMADMMSKLQPHPADPRLGGSGKVDWRAAQAHYEAGVKDAHSGLTAKMRDDLLRRREDLILEEYAATRANPRLNYLERKHEADMRGGAYAMPSHVDRYDSNIGPGRYPVDSGWQSSYDAQREAELYGPMADQLFIPYNENRTPPRPTRYGYGEMGFPDGGEGMIDKPYRPTYRDKPMEFPEYMGPSPYPSRMTQRERFMDMLQYFMEGTGEKFPVPKESKQHKKYWDELWEQKGGQKRK
jgi:hypothetical protein